MSVTALFLLSSLAVAAQAQSCTKPNGGANMDLKGDAILKDSFDDGSSVTFACVSGWEPKGGSATITCKAGKWTSLQMTCERFNCGPLSDVDNGNVDYPNLGTLFTDKAVITCNSGYNLVGKKEISCGKQGWLDRAPVCEVVKCSPPGDVPNASFYPVKEDAYSYSDVVIYKCEVDFTLSGSNQLKCSEDGKFHPGLPKCIRVECQDPKIENAEFVSGSRPPHKHAATVTYKCNPEYKMSGDSTITCNIDSQWSPGIPKCYKPDKDNKDEPGNGADPLVGGLIGGLIGLVVLVASVVACRKFCTQRNDAAKEAARDGEDVALS